MQNPVLDANFTLFNILSTVAYGVIIFTLVATNIRAAKHEKNPCKGSMVCRVLAILAFSLLIVNTWVSLPTT
ncbi:MAG: hypothetical protein S4CHLAM7_07780 [Chlamydiae bacterium]|nr:hypothetical protein [Chlamydiota bacterium]